MIGLFLGLLLAFSTALADEPKSKEEKSKMPMKSGYGKAKAPGYAKTAPMRATKPGPARATAAKSMPRPTRRGK